MIPTLGGVALSAALLTVSPVVAAEGAAAVLSERRSYAIVRLGSPIGRHVFEIRRDGPITRIVIDYRILVTVLSFRVYSLDQQGVEEWEGDRFRSLKLRTVINDETTDVEARAEDGRMRLTVNGRSTETEVMPPATLWRALPPRTEMVLDPADGDPTRITVTDAGEETLMIGGAPVRARHWVWTGGLNRDLWYDESGRLVRVRISGGDGSDVLYVPE